MRGYSSSQRGLTKMQGLESSSCSHVELLCLCLFRAALFAAAGGPPPAAKLSAGHVGGGVETRVHTTWRLADTGCKQNMSRMHRSCALKLRRKDAPRTGTRFHILRRSRNLMLRILGQSHDHARVERQVSTRCQRRRRQHPQHSSRPPAHPRVCRSPD